METNRECGGGISLPEKGVMVVKRIGTVVEEEARLACLRSSCRVADVKRMLRRQSLRSALRAYLSEHGLQVRSIGVHGDLVVLRFDGGDHVAIRYSNGRPQIQGFCLDGLVKEFLMKCLFRMEHAVKPVCWQGITKALEKNAVVEKREGLSSWTQIVVAHSREKPDVRFGVCMRDQTITVIFAPSAAADDVKAAKAFLDRIRMTLRSDGIELAEWDEDSVGGTRASAPARRAAVAGGGEA